jgi:O-antigen/teichoic acid export membrane protein
MMLARASGSAVLQVGSTGLAFIVSVLLARFLGGREYGIYALSIAWAGVLSVPAVMGFDRFSVRGLAVYAAHGQWRLARGLLLRATELVLLASGAIVLCACGLALELLPHVTAVAFCVSMGLVPLTALTSLRQAAMQAFGRIVTAQLPEYALRPAVMLGGVIALRLVVPRDLTSTAALVVNVAGVGIACAVGAVMLRRALPMALRLAVPSYAAREWTASTLPMMLVSLIFLANSYVGTILVGLLDGARAAGVYSVVDKGAAMIAVLLSAANMPLAPAIARLNARGDRMELERVTLRVAQAGFLASLPIAAGISVFPKVYLGLFGPGFTAGASAAVILSVGQLVNAAAGPAGNVLLMTGHEREAAAGVAIGLLANIGLAVALVPEFGVTGGAVAGATSVIVWNVVLLVLARKRVGINASAFSRLRLATRARAATSDGDPAP